MSFLNNPFKTLKSLKLDQEYHYYSLPALEELGIGVIQRLPVSIRVMLESLLRNCDGKKVTEEDIVRLAKWNPSAKGDVPFVVSRVLLQDFTGVPLLVDLAAMRDAVAKAGADPGIVEPLVPVDLIIDHSVQVDRSGTEDAFLFNLKLEFQRNQERYAFLKWGQQAFKTFTVYPPGMGICHQVNLEFLATVVTAKELQGKHVLYPDTLVGTDSHTTMINGLGVVGWGVGGIEGEAAMLGQPLVMEMPEVIGFQLDGKLKEGITATDLTLRITEILRKENVVGKFIEFFGEGASTLSVADRAMIANMAPEYGATMGFFPVDDKTLEYLKMTGRSEREIIRVKEYLVAQKLFGMPKSGEITYTKTVHLDLKTVVPCVAGPKRPQDRIALKDLRPSFYKLLEAPLAEGGYAKSTNELGKTVYVHADGTFSLSKEHACGGSIDVGSCDISDGWSESEMVTNRPFTKPLINPGYCEISHEDTMLGHGSVVIAAITSCTNTSNAYVMIGAGLVAKKAIEKGLKVNPMVKTSLAPGSRIVTDYLEKTGLQKYLNELGFQLVAYGCTTCIGNSGPLDERIEGAIKEYDLITASVLSGNRNFEARVHGSVKANFLMSPPLVVAFALAGRVDIDMEKEPLGFDKKGAPVFLKDIWPSAEEIDLTVRKSLDPSMFKQRYGNAQDAHATWKEIKTAKGGQYIWESKSTYIQNPPYFESFNVKIPPRKSLEGMRALLMLGDSVTTDHISPAGNFKKESSAGKYLMSLGIAPEDFNSYGSRRGNHEVMMRGTFANVRIKNKMADGKEGGFTKVFPEGDVVSIFEASEIYAQRKTPLIIFAGKDYGMGSSRDWAAKGTMLLGVRVVVASSYERIHRSNLVGMGILPLQFLGGASYESLGITGDEVFSIKGLEKTMIPKQEVILEIVKGKEKKEEKVLVRIDTPIEVDYYEQGGIMPFVLRQLLKSAR